MAYCMESLIDEAFTRMFNDKDCLTLSEKKARIECAHRCKKELPEDKARELFKKTLIKWIAKIKRDGLAESDIEHGQIAIEYKPKPHKSLSSAMAKGRKINSLEARCLSLRRNRDE